MQVNMPSRLLPAVVAVLHCLLTAEGVCPSQACIPLSRNGLNEPFSSLGGAELSARCLTQCGAEVEGLAEEFVTSYEIWRSVDETLLKNNDCPLFYRTKECQLGCSLRPDEPVSSDCRDLCVEQCEESCSFTQSCNGPCATELDCRRTWCRTGCDAFTNLEGLSGAVPSTPLEFMVQPRQDVPGLFDITSVTAAQAVPEEGISAFIFRVETTDETLYILQSSLTDTLDLSYFTCEEVSVSLAVVNRNGSSQFSPPTSICVPVHTLYTRGLDPPSAPRNLKVSRVVEDLRPGFLGHAEVTLSWDTPEERSEALTGYALRIETRRLGFPSEACGIPNVTMANISKDVNSYVLRAASVGEIPRFGPSYNNQRCRYNIELTSLPEADDNTGTFTLGFPVMFLAPIVDSPLAPAATSFCEKRVNPITGLIDIFLNFTYEFDLLIEEAIINYTVMVSDTTADGKAGTPPRGIFIYNPALIEESFRLSECTEGRTSSNFILTTTSDRVLGEVLVPDLCPRAEVDDLSNHYTVAMTLPRDDDGIWWRPSPNPNSYVCVESGTTERPSVVDADSIRILDDPPFMLINQGESRFRASFALEWDPPLKPYGAQDYEVYLGDQPVNESSDAPFVLTVQGTTSATLNRILVILEQDQIFLQIRSRNDFFVSNWSEPLDITSFNDSGDSLSGGIIGGIAAGVVIALLVAGVIFLVVFLCVNRRRKSKLLNSLQGDHRETVFLRYRGFERKRSNSEIIRKLLPMDDEWEIPPVTLEVEKQLGEGCFGQVYRGFVRGPIPGSRTMKDSICTTAAIKYLKTKANSSERKDFVNEIEMMKTVAKGGNPHVVGLIGCVTREEPLCLIIEYLKYGDLRAYLHSIKEELAMSKYVKKLKAAETSTMAQKNDAYVGYENLRQEVTERSDAELEERDAEDEAQPYLKPVKQEPQPYQTPVSAVAMSEESPYVTLGDVEPVNLVSFAYQIAAGMDYLSSLGIVHRDLACRNVLVGEGKALKIADFGLSRVVSEGDAYVKTSSGRLPIKWMAIESINDRVFTVQSDVWAFGVVVWEIATLGGFPYPSIRNEELRDYLLQDNRLEKPPNCADPIYEMMLQCWQANPAKRPQFSELRAFFENILMEASSYIQFSSLTDIAPLGDSEPVRQEPRSLTGKASNPYVVSPNKNIQQTTPLSTPTDEKTGIRPRTLGGETLLSPGDQERQDGETSTTTNSHIPTHPGKPDREE